MRQIFRTFRRYVATFRGQIILAFLTAIMTTFVVMAVLFSSQVNTALRFSRAQQLEEATNEIVRVVVDQINSGSTSLDTDGDLSVYLDFVYRTYDAYVWLVAPNGIIIMDTGIPAEATYTILNIPESLKGRDIRAGELPGFGEGTRPLLPQNFVGSAANPYGYTFTGGNYLGLFGSSSRSVWISVIRPVYDLAGNLFMVIQVHESYDLDSAVRRFMVSGMRLSVTVALVLAIVMITIITNYVTRPVKNLSNAANKAAMGDLSVRVPYPNTGARLPADDNPDAADEDSELPADEMILLIQTFNRMIERLDHANSDRRDFISSISHDLRTPLTSISGFVEGMLDGTIPPERYEHYLTIVKSETHRLTGLVQEMNDAVKLDTNAVNYDFQPFELNELVVDVISSLESLIEPKRISVQTNINDFKPSPRVIGDWDQLQRVLYNLVSNAIKFTPEDGVIAVMIHRPAKAGFIEIIVEDSGPGIDPKDLPHIFERFYKGDRSRTGHQGSGLGLYIARTILQAHGQHITAGKSLMGGARFSFTLQLA